MIKMNDKIYRQEAIDAICNCCYNNGETGDYRQCEYYRNEESSFCDFIAALRRLPFENDIALYVDGFHDGYKQAQMDMQGNKTKGEGCGCAMDQIKRRAAIQTALEFIVEYLGGAFDEDFQKKLMERMNTLPAAQPDKQWIPCSERLPEDETVVLVCTEDEFMYLAERTCGHWEEITGFCSVDDTVAWLPLPEPYKGE